MSGGLSLNRVKKKVKMTYQKLEDDGKWHVILARKQLSFRQNDMSFYYFVLNDISYGVIFAWVVWQKRHVVLWSMKNDMSFRPFAGYWSGSKTKRHFWKTKKRHVIFLMEFLASDPNDMSFSSETFSVVFGKWRVIYGMTIFFKKIINLVFLLIL